MPTQDHELAERLAAEAETLLRNGSVREARELYGQAADAEGRAVLTFIDQGKSRTFSILAVSHASLLYKSKRLGSADRFTCVYLGHSQLNEWARTKLRELLEVIWDEQTIERQGLEYSGEEIWFALRGGQVGTGTAPFDVALHYMNGANHLFYRSVEWSAKFDFRQRGDPPAAVVDALQARATQPTLGSYRFSVRLLKPRQLVLFPGENPEGRINPAEIAGFVVTFLQAAASRNEQGLEKVVPDRQYRRALLQLARNLVPTEPKMVREIEVLRLSHGHAESALLMEGAKDPINAAIRSARPPQPSDPSQTPSELRGVLRGLHLDRKWLEIHLTDGGTQHCETQDDVLDDVVGPMVNKPVLITGYWKVIRGVRKFLLEDIELA